MRRRRIASFNVAALGVAASLVTLTSFAPAHAYAPGEWVNDVKAIVRPVEPAAVPLPVTLHQANPGHEAWAQQTFDQRMAYNVTQPVLIPVAGPRAPAKDAPAPAARRPG